MKRVGPAVIVATLALLLGCGDTVTGTTTTGGGGEGATGDPSGPGSGAGGAGGGVTGGGGEGAGAMTVGDCFVDKHYPLAPNYDQYGPTPGSHCLGTNHQDIAGIERLVVLGDSISQGTAPTPASGYYRTLLGDSMAAAFPGVVVEECAVNGARVRDLLEGGDMQIQDCFPGVEDRTTLVVLTMGGNDVIQWPQDGLTQQEAEADAADIGARFRTAMEWFSDASRFPNGVYVIFAGVYEYTDGTGELGSCPTAGLIGLGGDYLAGAPALARLNELYMQTAVELGFDMIFLLDEFCGHGYRRDDENSTCYVGPDAEQYFDISCIHPTPAGHARIAEMFQAVVDE